MHNMSNLEEYWLQQQKITLGINFVSQEQESENTLGMESRQLKDLTLQPFKKSLWAIKSWTDFINEKT